MNKNYNDWDPKICEIKLSYDNVHYSMEIGYVKSFPDLYIRIFNDDINKFMGGIWTNQMMKSEIFKRLPTELLNNCYSNAMRIEKLKVFA